MKSAAEALALARRRLAAAGVEEPERDARRLLAHALGVGAERLMLVLPGALSPAAQACLDEVVRRREARQPVSQIIGHRAFWGREFSVTPDVLDPRPETETLVEAALALPFTRVLDLGTGSGCILLSLLAENTLARGTGVDISWPALAVARDNRDRLGLAARARLLHSDWYRAVRGRYDLIVANPPYIAAAEHASLTPEVRLWEPRVALTPGPDGLAACRVIAAGADAYLAEGGTILVEIGFDQGARATAIFRAAGFRQVCVLTDLDGRDRVVRAAHGESKPDGNSFRKMQN